MRRQFGADAVDIDTRESTCHVAFEEPEVLNFRKVSSAAEDANYALIGVTLDAKGTVVAGDCTTCATEVYYLKMPGTGQLLELAEPLPVGQVELQAEVIDWMGFHPRLVVQ